MIVFFFKQKTAYEMRISNWSSDVCSSDLIHPGALPKLPHRDQDMWAGPKGTLEYLVNVMWPLDPFTRENGGTRLWPGSHLDPDIPGMDEDEAIVPRLSPGVAFLFLGSTTHGGGRNCSRAPRRGHVGRFCPRRPKPS